MRVFSFSLTFGLALCIIVKEIKYPLDQFDLPMFISGESLHMMHGGEFSDCSREDFLFLDTETTGLSHGAGTVAFLVGVGYFTKEHFIVRQYLMRDYPEYELTILDACIAFGALIAEGAVDMFEYVKNLGMIYLFVVLGAFGTLKKAIRK